MGNNSTFISESDEAYSGVTLSGTVSVSDLDRESSESNMGYVVLVKGQSFKTQVERVSGNTIFEIRYAYDLNGESVTVPEGCTLKFEGGKLYSSAESATLNLDNTYIDASYPVFSLNLEITGSAVNDANPDWFEGDDADKIERALSVFHSIKLMSRDYLIDRQIDVINSVKIVGAGFGDFFGYGRDNASVVRDYSRSRLIATESNIGSVISFHETENAGRAFSLHIEGVSFEGTDRTSNGIEVVTPGAPSRPVNILSCNFKHFNHAIDVNTGGATTGDNSTNVGVLNIRSCNIVWNNWAIYGTGEYALMLVTVEGNLLDGNDGCIYAVSGLTNKQATLGSVIIRNNMIQSCDTPFTLQPRFGHVVIEGNYFEHPGGTSTNTIYTYGKTTNDDSGTSVKIVGNYESRNNTTVNWILRNVIVDFGEGHKKVRGRYSFEKCVVFGHFLGTLVSCNSSIFYKDCLPMTTPESYFAYKGFNKDVKYDGRYYKRMFTSASDHKVTTLQLKAQSTVAVGTYRFACRVRKPSSTNDKLLIYIGSTSYGGAMPLYPFLDGDFIWVHDLVLEESKTGVLQCLAYGGTDSNAFCAADIACAKLEEGSYIVPLITNTVRNVSMANFDDTKYVGLVIYDTDLNKCVVYNGTNWVNVDGSALS